MRNTTEYAGACVVGRGKEREFFGLNSLKLGALVIDTIHGDRIPLEPNKCITEKPPGLLLNDKQNDYRGKALSL